MSCPRRFYSGFIVARSWAPSSAALRAACRQGYVGLADVDYLVAVWGGILPVELIEEGIAFCVLADGPVGRGSFVHTRGLMCSWAWCASIALVEPRL